ncbi:glycosyltransferase family A protein [Adlercreutzia sp. ZJ154]|uniref:glycosyltransferase family A protein n=1 Tax=Adlercreutzia sp. ZJ154 TaxID=2709790 RepID=UPI0013EBC8EF|nr:glycosyltransferase family A protein [Adlercreutzia sp. ZJ154]
MINKQDHTFAVCAYKESPYLDECVKSVLEQTINTRVIICTSTPNEHIQATANQFGIPLFVNESKPGIASDWNFAIKTANTALVTIAHQDDIYCCDYAEHMINAIDNSQRPLLFFTNYGELRNNKKVADNNLLRTKRRLLRKLENSNNAFDKKIRKRALSLGSAICCPSVTLAVDNISKPVFQTKLKSNLDWEAWSRIAELDGDFLYDPEILMYHRIHEGSETSALIKDNTRTEEDLEMLKRFWPTPIARAINVIYSRGQNSNS